MVLLMRNILHALVMGLLITLLAIAAIYVLLLADLLAVVQLMVYVGGVLVLIIFGVMLTQRVKEGALIVQNHNRWWGGALGIAVASVLLYLIPLFNHPAAATPAEAATSTIQPAGLALLTTFVLPFELVSVLLLVALIGATYVAGKQ